MPARQTTHSNAPMLSNTQRKKTQVLHDVGCGGIMPCCLETASFAAAGRNHNDGDTPKVLFASVSRSAQENRPIIFDFFDPARPRPLKPAVNPMAQQLGAHAH